MKLSTATINDTQHEWLKRFAAGVEKNSGGRIKAEIYPASQLGPIPRQIEGVQFGSIQAWMGPPEFLIGVDERFEALSAPGLFSSVDQVMKVLQDPPVHKMIYGLGANKGLIGVGFAPIGPSSIISRKPVPKLAEFKGMKIRVLASPFQLELISRMGASPIAMTLADVVPGLQQGTIDGSLSTMTVYTTMQLYDVAKYVTNIDQPYVNSIVEMSKKWFDTLPPDLQKIVNDDGQKVSAEITPYVNEFFAEQYKLWMTKGGGTITDLPPADTTRWSPRSRPSATICRSRSPISTRRSRRVRIGEAQQVAAWPPGDGRVDDVAAPDGGMDWPIGGETGSKARAAR